MTTMRMRPIITMMALLLGTALLALLLLTSASAFTVTTTTSKNTCIPCCRYNRSNTNTDLLAMAGQQQNNLSKFVASAILVSTLAIGTPVSVLADEYGVETEAPTLFTGESVMICKKRGPLGACLETVPRTADNDNDKASKYFKDPVVQTAPLVTNSEDNSLILKLKQQSEDNREKNEDLVKQRTALNDQGASFGPFDRQVVILNTDGKTFTLLENPQAMRLKKAGFIEDRRFVKQPSVEDLEAFKDASNDGGGIFQLGGGFMRGILGTSKEE